MTIERKHYIITGIIIAVAFAFQPFALLFTQIYLAPKLVPALTGKTADGTPITEGKNVSTDNLKVRGDINAQIMLVEFSDYQCPFCTRFHPSAKAVFDKYNGKVSWAWKHFPLQFHPEAQPTAIFSECVFKLGGVEKFWLFTDAIMNNQENLNEALRKSEVTKLGLNTAAFTACVADPATKAKVDTEQNEGVTLGVNGTPNTFVVRNDNGKLTILETINGALPEATVMGIVEKYIK